MAEGIAALSLASNILQIIDFGSKFVSTAWRIYNATHRNLENFDEIASLSIINTNLSDILQDIRTQSGATELACESNRGILNLSRECATLVEKLVQSLNKLCLGDAARKRDALRVAFRLTWKQEELNAIQARLNDFRSQLTLSLLVSMRYYASQSLIQQNAILKGLQAAQESTQVKRSAIDNSFDTSDPFGTSVLNYVTWKLNRREQDQARSLLKTEIIRAIRDTSVSHSEIPSYVVGTTIPEDASKRALSLLLASLRYSGMNDREERISEAHETTFQWLLKDSDSDKWASFKGWLESDNKLYWITGKAGSGKSTLMKYICYPVKSAAELTPVPRCRKFLTAWSGDKRLAIASFYFWNSGIQTQMTQRGLIMSLLYQILEQCPQLAPLACPDRWETLSLFGEDLLAWEDQELRETLCRVTKSIAQINSTIALFVDGLDEFQGQPEALISLFKNIIEFSNIKICVASRPWVEFQDAFQHRPSLMLEDLTYNDIKSFVTSRFHREPMFAQLRRREEEFADQLIEGIVVKAAGVFLWVTLVVSSLIAGMGSGDRVSDFVRRLDQLPPDLSKLYEKILMSLDQFYLEHTAQLFSLVRTMPAPMNLVFASFVDEDDPDFAIRQPCRPLSEDETVLRMDTMRRRINSRSKGLLEVKGPLSTPEGFKYDNPWDHSRYTVQYLHRTVKDYIEGDEARIILQSTARSPFDPHLKLLAGHLAYIKRLDPDRISAWDLWVDNLRECLSLAGAVSPGNIPQMILLLDEMDRVGPAIFHALAARLRKNEYTPIPEPVLWAYRQDSFAKLDREGRLDDFKHTFLSLTVIFGIVEYIRVKAEAECLVQLPRFDTTADEMRHRGKWPLLMDAVTSGAGSLYHGNVLVPDSDLYLDHRMIQCLLEKFADPNYTVYNLHMGETSPLVESVSQLMFCGKHWKATQFWAETTRLLAHAGKLDRETVDRALVIFLETEGLGWPRFRLQTFIQWSRARKSLRKSLELIIHGGDPDFSAIIANVKKLTEGYRRPLEVWRDTMEPAGRRALEYSG